MIESALKWQREHPQQHLENARNHSRHLRSLVFQRIGRRCKWCGAISNLTLDHVYPIVRSGYRNTLSEWKDALLFPRRYFQTLCRSCNSSKAMKGKPWTVKRRQAV
jgi:5-methylcytosine-specific restriction endonuclease McrA